MKLSLEALGEDLTLDDFITALGVERCREILLMYVKRRERARVQRVYRKTHLQALREEIDALQEELESLPPTHDDEEETPDEDT